jgi:hypothetical protein
MFESFTNLHAAYVIDQPESNIAVPQQSVLKRHTVSKILCFYLLHLCSISFYRRVIKQKKLMSL